MDKCVFPEKKKHTKGLKLLLKWVQSDQTQALFALSFNAICYKDKQLLTSSTISPGLPTLLPHNKHMELVGKVWNRPAPGLPDWQPNMTFLEKACFQLIIEKQYVQFEACET